MALDKWQMRQAQAYADENKITYDEAVAKLFPQGEPAPLVDEQAPAEGDAVTLTK